MELYSDVDYPIVSDVVTCVLFIKRIYVASIQLGLLLNGSGVVLRGRERRTVVCKSLARLAGRGL